MKLIIKIFLLISCLFVMVYFTGCITNEKQAKRRVAKIVSNFPGVIDTTTKVTEKTIIGTSNISLHPIFTQSHIDSLMNIYCVLKNQDTSTDNDTTIIYKEKEVQKTLYKDCLGIQNGYYKIVDQNGDSVTLTIKSPKIIVTTSKKEKEVDKTIVVPCPSCELTWWQEIKKYFGLWMLLIAIGFFLGILAKTILKIWIKV